MRFSWNCFYLTYMLHSLISTLQLSAEFTVLLQGDCKEVQFLSNIPIEFGIKAICTDNLHPVVKNDWMCINVYILNRQLKEE